MIVVLDTNSLVSALLSPFGPSGRILDLVLSGEVTVAFDDRVMAEYQEVLNRDGLCPVRCLTRMMFSSLKLLSHPAPL